MASKALPSPEVLRQLLRYEPDTGKLFWRERPEEMFAEGCLGGRPAAAKRWNRIYAEKAAFTAKDTYGYHHGPILGKSRLAHRVIWALHYGEWPEGITIDHINGNRDDNRIANLRLATRSQNMRNTRKSSANTSGYKGVSQRGSRFFALIVVEGKRVSLGGHPTPEAAFAAYCAASKRLHGEFGRTS